MKVSTTAPLEDNERELLKAGFDGRGEHPELVDPRDLRTTHFFYSTGAHPWCLANPQRSLFRRTSDPTGYCLSWRRAKARTTKQPHVNIPLDPEIEPWVDDFLKRQLGYSEFEYFRRVRRFGDAVGLEGLSPRTLRHDFCWRALEAADGDLHTAMALSGTSLDVLLRYVKRRAARSLSTAQRGRMF